MFLLFLGLVLLLELVGALLQDLNIFFGHTLLRYADHVGHGSALDGLIELSLRNLVDSGVMLKLLEERVLLFVLASDDTGSFGVLELLLQVFLDLFLITKVDDFILAHFLFDIVLIYHADNLCELANELVELRQELSCVQSKIDLKVFNLLVLQAHADKNG